MEPSLVLTIIGSIIIAIGVLFNLKPELVNQKTMGEMGEEAAQASAGLRTVLGGQAIALGTIAIYCRDFTGDSAETILWAIGIGLLFIPATIIGTKVRGYSDEFPIPPVILLTVLSGLALYTATSM